MPICKTLINKKINHILLFILLIYIKYNTDGINICFFNFSSIYIKVNSFNAINKIYKSVFLKNFTLIKAYLKAIFNCYMKNHIKNREKKKLSYLIIIINSFLKNNLKFIIIAIAHKPSFLKVIYWQVMIKFFVMSGANR